MPKNKFLFVIFIPMALNALITQEQFMQLSEDKKWGIYSEHISNYRRIFKAKDEAIEQLEKNADWWQNVAIASTCCAIATALLGVSAAYVAIKNPRAPRE